MKATVFVTIEMRVTCPHCDKEFLLDDRLERLKVDGALVGEKETCPNCDKEIVLAGVEF